MRKRNFLSYFFNRICGPCKGSYKISCFQLILFLLSLLEILVNSSSSSSNLETHQKDFNKWVAWNVENHRKKVTNNLLASNLISTTKTNALLDNNNLDLKLKNAELNKVTISVGQDGSADFATINEALNSIPNRNIKRVILTIKPGVYRYHDL